MRNHPSGARKGTAQRLGPEDSSYVANGNLWLSHLEEGPDCGDEVRYRPDEIARGLLPVVKEEQSSLNQTQVLSDSTKTSSRNKDFSPSSGKKDASWVSFSDPVWVSLTPTALTPSFQMAQRVDLEDSDFQDHTKANRPSLEEGPDFKDQVRYTPGEISRCVLPVVEDEPLPLNQDQAQSDSIKTSSRNKDFSPSSGQKDASWVSFSDPFWVSLTPTALTPSFEMAQRVDPEDCDFEDHTKANRPSLEEGPDFKDQVRYTPGEISRCVLPIAKEGSPSMDQAQPQPNSLMGTPGGNPDNDLRNQMVTGKGGAGHQDTSTELDIENNDSTSDQDPSLVHAILVDNNTIVEAKQVVESKTLKCFIWLFALAVVAAGGLTLILLLLQKSTPEPIPAPTAGPTRDLTPFSCDLKIKTFCNFEHEKFPLLPCSVWAPPQQLAFCEYRPLGAVFLFNGGGCEQSDNLNFFNFTCTDFNGGPPINEGEAAFIQVAGSGGSGPILFEGPVVIGEDFAVSGFRDDDSVDLLDDDLKVSVFTLEQSLLLQEVNHVSLTCSSPLELNNRYGSVQAVGFYNIEQGPISEFASFSTALQLTIVIEVSDDGANTTLTELTAMTNFDGNFNFTDLLNLTDSAGFTVYAGQPVEFTGVVAHDDFSLHNYTLAFVFEGISNLDGSFCNGTDSSWFSVGYSELES